MTITSVAVATAKFLFGMCDCTVNSDVSTDDFARAGDFARVWTSAQATARVSGHRLLRYYL